MNPAMRTHGITVIATLLCTVTFGLARVQHRAVGIIDFYGLRNITEQQARRALGIKEGDPLPESSNQLESRLQALPNVEQWRITAVCCEAGKPILYVGIGESGSAFPTFRAAPRGSIRLPNEIMQVSESFFEALTRAIQKGDAGEDDTQGHALFNDAVTRAFQERFAQFAARDLKLARAVLHQSSDPEHRAVAAQIIGYAADKKEAVQDLAYGMSDPDADVRNNCMRALAIIASFAQTHPELHIKVPTMPFVDMLNSLEWTDRNKASWALLSLTEKRDAELLSALRQRAVPALVEMARWRSPGHAQAAFFILGRLADCPEQEIQKAWSGQRRESFVEEAARKLGSPDPAI